MKLTIDALKKLLSQSTNTPCSGQISNSKSRFPRRRRGNRKRRAQQTLGFETLQPRALLATFATTDGAWSDPATWDNGVPDATQRAIISQGVTVELDGADNEAKELVIQGNLIVTEDAAVPEKTLDTRWVHVNSGGLFEVGSEADRYDDASFTLTLNGNDPESVHTIEGVGMDLKNNDGFLMTAGQGQIQFFGEEKLSFTKLAETAEPAETGIQTITVENIIERNFNKGEISGDEFVKSADDDGELNWVAGDQIVIASSSYNYTEEEVRFITNVQNNGSTTTLTLDEPLNYRHYGEIETYGNTTAAGTTAASQEYSIDLRAEVALLSRNIKIQSNQDPDNNPRSRDTDVEFGDRENVVYEARFKDANGNPIQSKDVTREMAESAGLSHEEAKALPNERVANGVGGHLMFMPSSGAITVDGVQLDGLGQAGRKGRYPIHWHLGDSRPNDILRNSSVTNSNNRGVTIHGTSDLQIEGVVLHDIHGHGFFFEDAVEMGNELIGNIALGIHVVGGNDSDAANPGGKDPFVVDTHDSVLETGSRFSSSAAFWITNPNNTFVGNIAAGAGDTRTDEYAGNEEQGVSAGTGFWYALPRTILGESAGDSQYANVIPIFTEFGQFDYNTSHTTAVGLNFDRGSDIEDGNWDGELRTTHGANEYSPRADVNNANTKTVHTITGFTNYKATGAAFYHRGEGNTITLDGLRVADSYNGPWAVSENLYDNSLFVGHSDGNADFTAEVGGPRLYDGAGLYTNTHFAGFSSPNAYAFQVEGSSFGPTMYHAFQGTSFENDGTYANIAHAVSDFQVDDTSAGHDLGQPSRWIKAVIDLDGTLTGGVGGGSGYSIVPNVDFLVDGDDIKPAGWDAWLTNDIYARIRIQNLDDGVALFPSELFPSKENPEPLIRYTAPSGKSIEAVAGHDINQQFYWTQIAAKADSDGNGVVADDFVIEFLRNGLPTGGFELNMNNQDGNRPELNPAIDQRVNDARIVLKFVGAANYSLKINGQNIMKVDTEAALRSANGQVVYYTDDQGDLYLNTTIVDNQPKIEFVPGEPLQTAFVPNTVDYGTTIEAENFDVSTEGINGIAYFETDATNSLGSFRSDTGVDVTPTKVGSLADGEWLEYTANITSAAYNIGVNVSSTAAGGSIRVLAANSNSAGYLRELGTINVPDTGGAFTTRWIEGADLGFAAGDEGVIRLEFIGDLAQGNVEVDSIEFAAATQTPSMDWVIRNDLTTSTIELEHFDVGGQGASYFDTEPGNKSSTTFRTGEDVDVNDTQLQGDVLDGEWLEYTTDIQSGVYDITLEKAWGFAGSGVKLFVGDSNAATNFTQLGEFTFTTNDENVAITLEDINLSPFAGSDRVIRIEIVGNFMGLDRLNFQSKPSSAPTVESVIVNGGNEQRKTVSEVAVTFSTDVGDVTANSFILMNTSTNTQIVPLVTTSDVDGKTVATLTFSGTGVINGSLADGDYTLTTRASEVTDASGNLLDGDGDGIGGDDATDNFFRRYGDIDLDGEANFLDISPFIAALTSNEYRLEADANGDGVVNFLDIASFISLLTNS